MALLPHVIEKLKASEARYEQLMALVSDQAVQSDGNAYRKYSKELSDVLGSVIPEDLPPDELGIGDDVVRTCRRALHRAVPYTSPTRY